MNIEGGNYVSFYSIKILDIVNILISRYDEVEVQTDSQYACNCMEEWVYKWMENGWTTCQGK